MASSPEELERTKLIRDLLAEISTQAHLKRQVLEELRPEKKKGHFEHPAVLLVLGFLFTGVLGTFLTSCWQQREWANQQQALQRQQDLEIKRQLINDVSRSVAETLAAAEDVLAMFAYQDSKAEIQKMQDSVQKHWQETSRQWRVAWKTLTPRIAIYFQDIAINQAFEKIVDERRLIGNDIANYLGQRDESGVIKPPELAVQRESLSKINSAVKSLTDLTQRMIVSTSSH